MEKEKIWAGGFFISTVILIFAGLLTFTIVPPYYAGCMILLIVLYRLFMLSFDGYDYITR